MTTPALSNHLADGYADGRPGEPVSLQEVGRAWTDASDTGYRPTSVLQQLHLSPNGSSARDAERQLMDGSFLPTQNGSSESTNTADTPLRLIGNL